MKNKTFNSRKLLKISFRWSLYGITTISILWIWAILVPAFASDNNIFSLHQAYDSLEDFKDYGDKGKAEDGPSPLERRKNDHWLNNLFVEDDAGVLNRVKNQIQTWENEEKYYSIWNLKSSVIYSPATLSDKKKFLRKNALKYFDKRLGEEIKKAKKDSTLAKVSTVKQALRPKTKVQVAKNIKVKFRARALQGKATMLVENPYVDYYTNFSINGRVHMHLGKNIDGIGVKTEFNYRMKERNWDVIINKTLTDDLSASLSYIKDLRRITLRDDVNKIIRLNYGTSF